MKRAVIVIAGAVLLTPVLTTPASAQPPWRSGAPESAFQIRLGGYMLSGDSDFWDSTEEISTLNSSDLDDFILGFTYLHSTSNNLDVGVNVDFFDGSGSSVFFGEPDPYWHDLEMVPLTLDVRFIPGGRYRIRPGGRQVLKPLFYVGGGIGMTFWEYEEVSQVFLDRYVDDGVAFEAHLLAGFEMPVGRRTNLLLEARFSESEDDLGGDFDFLELVETDLDLGGTSIQAGLSFRF